MKRRRAILLFGVLTALVGSYVAWCCRPFYLRPDLEIDEGVPEEARVAIENWWDETGGFEPIPVSWEGIWHVISTPYDSWERSVLTVDFSRVGNNGDRGFVWVTYGGRLEVFLRRRDGWEYNGPSSTFAPNWWEHGR